MKARARQTDSGLWVVDEIVTDSGLYITWPEFHNTKEQAENKIRFMERLEQDKNPNK